MKAFLIRQGWIPDLDVVTGQFTLCREKTATVLNEIFLARTIERGWHDNRPGQSCIPSGVYKCVRDFYHDGGYPAFEIMNVPDRQRVLIHIANFSHQLKGCIALGREHAIIKDPVLSKYYLAISQATIVFNQFMHLLEGVNSFDLSIEWNVPEIGGLKLVR
jgi:hypothetical protein